MAQLDWNGVRALRTLLIAFLAVLAAADCGEFGTARRGVPADSRNVVHARSRASVEFQCPDSGVNLTPLIQQNGTDTFQVDACGKRTFYTCIDDGPCIKEGAFGVP